MSARKLIYRLMVCAPAIFLAGIGVHARGLTDEFDVIANDDRTERMTLAYAPYVREALDGLERNKSVEICRQLAAKWIAGAEKGELKPLPPIAYEDTSSEGPKSQAFDVRARIVSRLMTSTFQEVRAGKLHEAAVDANLAIRLAEVQKYSDFISLFNCATEERRTLDGIKPIVDKLSADDKAMLAKSIRLVKGDSEVIESMVKHSRQHFLAWRDRRGFEPLSIEDTHLLSDIPAMVLGTTATVMKEMRSRMFASRDDHLPIYYSSLRLGVGAQKSLDDEHTKILDVLQK